VEQEGTLDANTVRGHASDGEVGIVTAFAGADDDALEDLDTFLVAFNDKRVNLHSVAHFNGGMAAIFHRHCCQKFLGVHYSAFPKKTRI
jgi:hypothetical protein